MPAKERTGEQIVYEEVNAILECPLFIALAALLVIVLPSAANAETLEWLQRIDHSAHGVSTDGRGNVYVSGAGDAGLRATDAFVSKFDASGTRQWTSPFGTDKTEYGFDVAADWSGDVYITGVTSGRLASDSRGGDVYIRKLDENGSHQWTRQFGTSSYDVSYAISLDALGNSYVSRRGESKESKSPCRTPPCRAQRPYFWQTHGKSVLSSPGDLGGAAPNAIPFGRLLLYNVGTRPSIRREGVNIPSTDRNGDARLDSLLIEELSVILRHGAYADSKIHKLKRTVGSASDCRAAEGGSRV